MRLPLVTAFVAVTLLALPAQAADLRSGQSLVVGKAERLEQNLYASGQSVSLEGETTGDALAAGWHVSLPGRVGEDAALAGMTVVSSGAVGGDLRIAGKDVTVSSAVGGETVIFGSSVQVLGTASIAGDLVIYADKVIVSGNVGGNLTVHASSVDFSGRVGGLADLEATGSLRFGSEAYVAGPTTYRSPKAVAVPAGLAGANYVGQVAAEDGQSGDSGSSAGSRGRAAEGFGDWALGFAEASAAGLVFFLISRRRLESVAQEAGEKPWSRCGLAALVLVALPLSLVALVVTIVGLPIALLTAMAYGLVTLIAWSAAGSVVGLFVSRRVPRLSSRSFDWLTVVGGTLVLQSVAAVPFLGKVAYLVILMAVEGVIFLRSWRTVASWLERR